MNSEIIVHLLEGEVMPTSDLFCKSSSYASRTPNYFVRYRYDENKRKWIFAETAPAYGSGASTVRI